jgi:16S rRNA (guanine527-N7)-methyltransferase
MFTISLFADLLRARLAGIVELTSAQIELLQGHYELLVKWNQTLNLTRIESIEEAVERHYAESLFLASLLPVAALSSAALSSAAMPSAAGLGNGSLRIVDIGSGGGFPGLPVAIFRPDCSVTLIESHQRKAVFLKEASRKLANVKVLAKRAEEVALGDKREFDIAISRAVSYADLAKPLKLLAASAYLLTGAEEPPDKIGFVSSKALALPWEVERPAQRFLRILDFVSRETGPVSPDVPIA